MAYHVQIFLRSVAFLYSQRTFATNWPLLGARGYLSRVGYWNSRIHPECVGSDFRCVSHEGTFHLERRRPSRDFHRTDLIQAWRTQGRWVARLCWTS